MNTAKIIGVIVIDEDTEEQSTILMNELEYVGIKSGIPFLGLFCENKQLLLGVLYKSNIDDLFKNKE